MSSAERETLKIASSWGTDSGWRLRASAVDIVTIGQYLQPSARQLKVERYVAPEEFRSFKVAAEQLGFRHVEAGPLVRSSYHAWSHVN